MVSAGVDFDPAGSDQAGDYTSYQLTFTTTNDIPAGSYFIITIPTDFTLEVEQ